MRFTLPSGRRIEMKRDPLITRWAMAWAALACAIGLHVADEALTGFLPRYNALVLSMRETYRWFPFPTFTFPVWLGGLVLGVLILFALLPLVLKGYAWLRYASYALGVLMIGNALAHMTASLLIHDFAPGVYSSPVLLVTAIVLLRAAVKAKKAG